MTARAARAHPGEPADFEDAIVAWRQYRKLIDQCNTANYVLLELLGDVRQDVFHRLVEMNGHANSMPPKAAAGYVAEWVTPIENRLARIDEALRGTS